MILVALVILSGTHKKSIFGKPLTTAVIGTRVWVGVDNVWEQKKPEARKMLVNRADSHTSGARFVRCVFAFQTLWLMARRPKLKQGCQYQKRPVVPSPKRIVQNTKRLTTYLRLILLLAQFLFQHQ